MEENNLSTLSFKRAAGLIIHYFGFYIYGYPLVFSWLTLYFDPEAVMVAVPFQYLAYGLTFIVTWLLIRPVLKDSWQRFKISYLYMIKKIFYYLFLMLAVNIVLSLVVALITQTATSENQETIAAANQVQPLLNLVATLIFAPFVEESVFRGGVFLYLRKHHSVWVAAIVSSLFFGFIHVSDSLWGGNFLDVGYLLVYAGIGFILALAYEKTNSIIPCMCIHALSNLAALLMMSA